MRRDFSNVDLTEEILYLEKEKKKAAKEMNQRYLMIWIPKKGKHIERREIGVDEFFMMFPEISPAFFKHFNLNEVVFRFKSGTATFIRRRK